MPRRRGLRRGDGNADLRADTLTVGFEMGVFDDPSVSRKADSSPCTGEPYIEDGDRNARARVSGIGPFRPNISDWEEKWVAKTMRRKYICTNGVVEVTQFVVGDKQTGGRKWHRAKSTEDKRDENARQAVRVAARILNCNYCTDDVMLTMTYSDEEHERLFAGLDPDETMEKAKKALSNTLEKVRKELRSADQKRDNTSPQSPAATAPLDAPRGADMRTFAVTADMDGETGELVRVHHHVVVTAAAARTIADRWNHGIVHTENLYKQDDYTPLAAYLLGQVRHREGKKKYSCSRNMVDLQGNSVSASRSKTACT